jgi:hypothetical protein
MFPTYPKQSKISVKLTFTNTQLRIGCIALFGSKSYDQK